MMGPVDSNRTHHALGPLNDLVAQHADSFDQWWTRTSALAGPLANMLDALPDDAAAELQGRLIEAARDYETPTGLDFPGVSLIASARRA